MEKRLDHASPGATASVFDAQKSTAVGAEVCMERSGICHSAIAD